MLLLCISESVIYLCLVALLWGVTVPFIKKGAQGLEDVKATSVYGQFIKELVFLLTSLRVCYTDTRYDVNKILKVAMIASKLNHCKYNCV